MSTPEERAAKRDAMMAADGRDLSAQGTLARMPVLNDPIISEAVAGLEDWRNDENNHAPTPIVRTLLHYADGSGKGHLVHRDLRRIVADLYGLPMMVRVAGSLAMPMPALLVRGSWCVLLTNYNEYSITYRVTDERLSIEPRSFALAERIISGIADAGLIEAGKLTREDKRRIKAIVDEVLNA